MYKQLPSPPLNDFFTDLGKRLGISGAVEQVNETTKTLDKASGSIDNINATVQGMKKEYDYLKPIIITFFGIQATVWITEIIRNFQLIAEKK